MTLMSRYLLTLVCIAALAAAFVACGGDDDDDDPTATATQSAESPTNTAEPDDTESPEPTETPDPGDGLPDFVAPGTVEEDDSLEPQGLPQLVDVRIGENDGYDRIVFEFEEDELPPWEVMYVSNPVACGSGKPVVTGGAANLQVNMFIAQAHTPEGELTIPDTEIVADYPAMVEGVQTCDFEALVTWVVGTNGTLPFRVFTLEEPTRLVVDVEHP
jgi:hypothetical protein